MVRTSPLRAIFRFLVFVPLLAWPVVDQGLLRIACFDFPRSFNPVYATNETAQAVANKIYQSLFYFDPQGTPRPELVDSFSCDKAGREVSLTLKGGARFADGSPLDSADVVATVALLRDPRIEYPYLADLEFLESVEASGPLRLRLRLRRKFAAWKNYLTFKVLSAGQTRGVDPQQFRQVAPLGSGPYRLGAVEESRRFELDRNPHWPAGLRYDRIRYTVLGDPRQAPLKLLNAEVDAVEIHGDDAAAYARLKKWQQRFRLLPYKKFGYTYLAFNLRDPGIDTNLRRLFYGRLYNTRFLDDFLQGRGERVFSPFLLFGAEKRPRPLPARPWTGKRRLRILTNSESVVRRHLVLFLCEEMKACGIELEPVFVEYQVFLQRLKRGDFDLAVSAFLLDMDWNMRDVLSGNGYFNYAGYTDARMDALLEQGLGEMDEQKRRAIYGRAHDVWLESLPLLPLFNLNYYMGVARAITVPARRFDRIGSCGDFFYNLQGW
jgi:peptide/nickel transport system substrate-binding protein